ncbi:hypothetical protein AA313_de0209854 [Arthrobotrys entomopaga]|nr:hypothetical protein AA313_de0209854 [Arthrobotrys entomopaga]
MSFDFGTTPLASKTPLIAAVDIIPLHAVPATPDATTSATPDATAPANPLITSISPKLDNTGTTPTPSTSLPSPTMSANAFLSSQSAIIGLVLGILVFLLVLVSFVHVTLVKRRKKEDNEKADEEVATDSGVGGRDSDDVSPPPPLYSPRKPETGEIPIIMPNDERKSNVERIVAVHEDTGDRGTHVNYGYRKGKRFGKRTFTVRREAPGPVRSLRILV